MIAIFTVKSASTVSSSASLYSALFIAHFYTAFLYHIFIAHFYTTFLYRIFIPHFYTAFL